MKTQLFAPEIDNIIDNINRETAPVNPDIYRTLKNIYAVFSCVKPVGDDELRETWLEVGRGPIEAFGNFEEFQESGEVETMNDFEQLWIDYYPDETKWYKFQTAKYEDNLYFRVCEIGYDANGYFKNSSETLSPRDKYLSFADGRDAGLRDIDGDSPDAFNEWYDNGSRMGAHPWEICRGGNSTHISLYVLKKDGKWIFDLAGSSIVRVEETVRMAVAFYENKIPFELRDADEIIRMVSGEDFIGIVPDTVSPNYCHSLFPEEDRIIDFMNLGLDKEIVPSVVEKAQWFPLERIEMGG